MFKGIGFLFFYPWIEKLNLTPTNDIKVHVKDGLNVTLKRNKNTRRNKNPTKSITASP